MDGDDSARASCVRAKWEDHVTRGTRRTVGSADTFLNVTSKISPVFTVEPTQGIGIFTDTTTTPHNLASHVTVLVTFPLVALGAYLSLP